MLVTGREKDSRHRNPGRSTTMNNDPKMPISKAVDTPDTDPENSEVEGHVMRIKAVEQPTDADVSEDGPEVQGHVVRRGAVDPPADGDDETASGDTESLARKY
jgi:hypothetical protein